MASEEKTVNVKLLVDKEKRRVVLAESDKDFVDILFSFLTLPLGTIIRLLNKESGIGSVDKLYESVENLDVTHFQTEACKTMLLHPRSAAAALCEDLELNIDDAKAREIYVCGNADCCSKATCFGCFVQNACCPYCRQIMNNVKKYPKSNADKSGEATGDGVFIKGDVKFLITDDLHVRPFSLHRMFSLFQKFGIKDASVLEEQNLKFNKHNILRLLQRLLISKVLLTDIFFENNTAMESEVDMHKQEMQCITEVNEDNGSKVMSLKLLVDKRNNKVVCGEGVEDMINLLLSFITFPLGSIIKLLRKKAGFGCVDNLYNSVDALSLNYMKSEKCKSMLLSPKLPPFFICNNNLLNMTEESPVLDSYLARGCHTCYWNNGNTECKETKCVHGVGRATLYELNPKTAKGGTEAGGGYTKGSFLVLNDFLVFPLSLAGAMKFLSSLELSFDNIVEIEAILGEIQVLDFLRAALISKSPLSDVFPVESMQNLKRKRMGP